MENQLEVIVKESGLEKSKAQVVLDKFSNYFQIAAEWEERAKTLIVINEDQKVEMALARTGRLFLKEKRIAIENTRKELKESILREGKAIDGIANVLKALIVPIETYLDNQEHFVENKEKEKEAAIRKEIEERLEKERIGKEAKERIQNERLTIISPYRDYWVGVIDHEKLSELPEDEFASKLNQLKYNKDQDQKEQERIRKENEKLKKQAEKKEQETKDKQTESDRILREQKAEANKKQKEIENKNRIELEKKEKKIKRVTVVHKTKLAAEKKERERIQAELDKLIECPKCHHKFALDQK